MMATTHAFGGLAVVAPLAAVAPEYATPLAVGALLGGIAPDADLVAGHRRTLHFPVLGVLPAVLGLGFALAVPSSATVTLAAFLAAAWLHAASDALGGGLEMDPWRNPTERAVYDHLRGRWIRPRRWIRYDGAPEDAALAAVLAVPALLVFEGPLAAVILGGVVLSVGYALFRRRIAELAPEWLE